MNRQIVLGWVAAVASAFVWTGCNGQRETTEVPGGDAPAHPGAQLEGREEPTRAAAQGTEVKGADDKALPKVRDRDPEEEKKKMALSRQRSGQARELLRRGALTQAIDHARQALRVHEQNVDAMLVVAEAFYRQGKYELTQAVTSSALAVDPKIRTPRDTSRAHNLMGFALIALGKETQATSAFRKAAETDEKNAAAWNNLGTRYLDAGDVDTALSCFEYALELEPRFPSAQVNHGAALRAKRRWVDAEKALRRALELKKSYAEAYFNLGVLYLDADPFPGLDTTQRLNKAIQNLTKYRELAIADGARGPGPRRPSVPGATPGAGSPGGRGPASVGPAVSRERADDYIRVAKKGLEREQRRMEREKKREAKATAAEAGGSPDTRGDATEATGADEPTQAPKKPSTSGDAGSKPPSSDPDRSPPDEPAPKQPAPKQPAPKQPAPKQPAPKQPAPQKPKVQKPSGHASGHRSKKDPIAWNPRGRPDTHRKGLCSARPMGLEMGLVFDDEKIV